MGFTPARRDEAAREHLQRIYESRGFRQTFVPRFEEYSFYTENKAFFQGEGFLSFMSPDGRMMALCPDITLSIVRNIPSSPMTCTQKLYYVEEVCRLSRDEQQYRFIRQIGVELIGQSDPFACVELVSLACESLEAISPDFVLDISHLGFVAGLIEHLGLNERQTALFMDALRTKSPHYLWEALSCSGADEALKTSLMPLAGTSGLDAIRAMVSTPKTACAFGELKTVADTLSDSRIRLDFAVTGDLGYYNGIVMQGYVPGLPDALLNGGRYDRLMDKLGKSSRAAGFAVALSMLGGHKEADETDIVIKYPPDCNFAALLKAERDLRQGGENVRLLREDEELPPGSGRIISLGGEEK